MFYEVEGRRNIEINTWYSRTGGSEEGEDDDEKSGGKSGTKNRKKGVNLGKE